MELDANGMARDANAKGEVSLGKQRVGGVLFTAGGAAMVYFFAVRPAQDGLRTGVMHYTIKGVLLGPLLVYMGLCMLVTGLQDGQIRYLAADGRKYLTTKGKWFGVGLVVVMVATALGWWWTLRSIGFQAF